ncbi:hypothetical protein GCM10020000_09810 [Streptomyces olivoverticillatus]
MDSGGSGLRLALAADGGPALTWSTPVPVETGARGIDAGAFLDRMLPAARELLRRAGSRRCEAVCVGASGMSTLGRDLRAVLPGALREALGVHRLALASDAVTAYAGALGQRPGAVVAAGTGLVALGTDLTPDGGWRRADGWGASARRLRQRRLDRAGRAGSGDARPRRPQRRLRTAAETAGSRLRSGR